MGRRGQGDSSLGGAPAYPSAYARAMALVVGWFLFALAAALDLVGFVAARSLAALPGRARLRVAFGGEAGAWSRAGIGRRLVFVVAGPIGWYLAAAFFFAGSLIGGEAVMDDASMRVAVVPGGPAARGGLSDGDVIVSVDATPTPGWAQRKTDLAMA